ncbi:MAG: hypothetical protein ACKO4S_11370 [Snowella sp.]
MSTGTKSELKELKDLITDGFTKLQANQMRLEEKMNNLESRMSKIEGTLLGQQPYVQKIPDLAERVGELKNWKQIGLTLSGALLGALITYLAKSSNP